MADRVDFFGCFEFDRTIPSGHHSIDSDSGALASNYLT